MKNPFKPGDQKRFRRKVRPEDSPQFDALDKPSGGGNVHPVYSTYALARDAEWAGRLFVLDMKEPGEEGIGTSISVRHMAPAMVGSEVEIVATFDSLEGNEIRNTFEAYCGDRLIAKGEQGQKILPAEKLQKAFLRAQTEQGHGPE